jgi:hypothetical protein
MKKEILILAASVLFAITSKAQINLIGARANQSTGFVNIIKWQALVPGSVTAYPSTLNAYIYGSSLFDAYNSNYYLSGFSATGYGLLAYNSATNTQSMASYNAFTSVSEIDMSTGKIYNLKSDSIGYFSISEYNLSTGSSSTLGVVSEPGINGIISDATCFDSNNGILYYVGYDTLPSLCLYSIPVRNTDFSYTKTTLLTTAPGNNISSVNYDNVQNTIFAMNAEYSAQGNYTGNKVVELNKSTGEVTSRGSLTGFEAFLGGSSSFDQNSGSLLLVGFDASSALRMIVFNTYDNTYQTGFMPGNVSEIVCDNYAFAKSAYTTTSVGEIKTNGVNLYPNPATSMITVTNGAEYSENTRLSIYNANGKLMMLNQFQNKDRVELNVSGLKPGIYLLRAESKRGGNETHKVVIR